MDVNTFRCSHILHVTGGPSGAFNLYSTIMPPPAFSPGWYWSEKDGTCTTACSSVSLSCAAGLSYAKIVIGSSGVSSSTVGAALLNSAVDTAVKRKIVAANGPAPNTVSISSSHCGFGVYRLDSSNLYLCDTADTNYDLFCYCA